MTPRSLFVLFACVYLGTACDDVAGEAADSNMVSDAGATPVDGSQLGSDRGVTDGAIDANDPADANSGPDGQLLEPDAAVIQPDATVAQPDATVAQPDATVAQPDAAVIQPDATVVQPDAEVIQPDAGVIQPDAAVIQPDAAVIQPDAAVIQPDAAVVQPDAGNGCVPEPFETCNGVDDDCDGTIDEQAQGTFQDCNTGLPGNCASGNTRCLGGQMVCEQFNPVRVESCNNRDDDCDGTVDEGIIGRPADCSANARGICRPGQRICDAGQFICASIESPRAEICDGLDTNCNGVVDDVPGTLEFCVSGRGECTVSGLLRCLADGSVGCDAIPAPAVDEICDGLDNDCDGVVDNGVCVCGDGMLQAGETCDDGNTDAMDGCGPDCQPELDLIPGLQRDVSSLLLRQRGWTECHSARNTDEGAFLPGVSDDCVGADLLLACANDLGEFAFTIEGDYETIMAAAPGEGEAHNGALWHFGPGSIGGLVGDEGVTVAITQNRLESTIFGGDRCGPLIVAGRPDYTVRLFTRGARVQDPCVDYVVLDDASRNVVSGLPADAEAADDNLDLPMGQPRWFRFEGAAGDRMPNVAPVGRQYVDRRCSTDVPGWMEGAHPTEDEGVVERTACFASSQFADPCRWRRPMRARNCGGFFVYELPRTRLTARYCGETAL